MTLNIREEVHKVVDKLSETQLTDVLRFMELVISNRENTDIEPEEIWLLTSGILKQLTDEIENAPAPVEDWRKHLHDL
ncbi:MAG: hypothetical protein H7Y09_00760 [Chitinophagaceae bacterium]|nr:hypothetical protein [Anaerolineae bacterium]